MKYSSKQKLAMAMAAGMVVSMAPAMAFAAEVDFVNTAKELGKEPAADRADLTKINTVEAKKVLVEAKKVVNGDANAQALVNAYEASIEVYEAFVAKDKTAFKAAVDKFTLNSNVVKTYVKESADYTNGLGHAQSRFAAWDATLNPSLPGETLPGLNYEVVALTPGISILYINVPAQIDKTTVKAADISIEDGGVALKINGAQAHESEAKVAVALAQDDYKKINAATVIKLTSGGKTYTVTPK